MATELFRHQSSMAYYDNDRSGCMWGLFKFLGMHKHIHLSKMLSYRDAKHKAGTEFLSLGQYDISAEKEFMLNKKAVTRMETKERAKKKSLIGASNLINFLCKKMIKKKDNKLKLSSSSLLLRTLSIHHLECNDYVLPNDSVSNTNFPTVDLNSNELVLSENENIDQPLTHTKGSAFYKQQVKDAIKENIKMEHLIALDGVLDKIPIDQKTNIKLQLDKRSKFGSEGYVNTNSRLAKRTIQRSRSLTESLEKYSDTLEAHASFLSSNSVNRDNTSINKRTLRSNSLTESFEIYSRMLESVSLKDNQQHYQRLGSVKEHDAVYAHKRTTRSRSLSGSLDVYSRILESILTGEHKKHPERLRSVKEENVISHSDLGSFSLDNNALNEISPQSTEKQDSDLLIVDKMMSDGLVLNVEETGERIEKSETDTKEGQNGISTKPTPVSVLDPIIDEDPISPIYTCNEAAKQQSSWICFEENDESKSTHHTDTAHSCDSNNHTLTIEELEFNYVKKALTNSRFCEGLNEFLSAWYSSYEQGDQLLFVDEESIKDEMFSGMALDHRLLLLDLMNETLMESYELTIASVTGLSRYSASVRPLFVGDRLVEEVWRRVDWHLSSHNDICGTLESEEDRYFAKADGWGSLLFDVERVGTEMEGLILDELLDELVGDCLCV